MHAAVQLGMIFQNPSHRGPIGKNLGSGLRRKAWLLQTEQMLLTVLGNLF
jgi:hypothetical protein